MAKGHEAGTLIFNQLETFNESVVYFENVLQPVVKAGIDSCVDAFCKTEKWDGKFDFAGEEDNCWLAPGHWNIASKDKKAYFKASFFIGKVDDKDDYWTALFCGVGNAGGEAGFMFNCEDKKFGGKIAWKNCVKSAGKVVEDILALGFKNRNDGSFFLPVHLKASELAKTWDDSGAFKENDDCFQPVRDALKRIAEAVPHFEALMQSCQGKSKTKP